MIRRLAPLALLVFSACGSSPAPTPVVTDTTPECQTKTTEKACECSTFTPPQAKAFVSGTDFETGCLAYSSWEQCMLCVVGEETMQGGGNYELEGFGCSTEHYYELAKWETQFPEDDTRRMSKEDQEYLFKDLLLFSPVVPEPKTFSPNGKAMRLGSKAELRWKRVVNGEEGEEITGVWETFEGELEIACLRDGKPTKHRVLSESLYESDGEPSAQVWQVGSKVIVLVQWSLGIEGDSGGATVGSWVDLDKECGT